MNERSFQLKSSHRTSPGIGIDLWNASIESLTGMEVLNESMESSPRMEIWNGYMDQMELSMGPGASVCICQFYIFTLL